LLEEATPLSQNLTFGTWYNLGSVLIVLIIVHILIHLGVYVYKGLYIGYKDKQKRVIHLNDTKHLGQMDDKWW